MQVQIDYFGDNPPGDATRYIVGKHTTELVDQILRDLDEFSLKPHLKEKSLCQLYSLIVCVEGKIKPHVERILTRIVYKDILNEEPGIADRVLKITEILGLYVPMDYMLPKIITHLTDSESKSVPMYVSSCLTALSAVITHSSVRFAD